MTLEEIFNDPEKYHDNVRITRSELNNPNYPDTHRSFPIHWIKQLIKWSKEESKNKVDEDTKKQLSMDDWEVFDDN